MARQLTFRIKRKEYTVIPVKIDRKKLYGWTEIIALDEQGRTCNLVSTDDTGTLIIPKGGTALGMLSSDGKWVERTQLKTVRQDGSEAEIIPSSFSVVIPLKQKVTDEEFLDYSITDFYQLDNVPDDLLKAIADDIYTFDYTYLDSYETTPAFLMVADATLFMLLGYKNRFDMLCLGECSVVDDDDDYIEVTDDDIDFSMF